jgi:hypothetical protein
MYGFDFRNIINNTNQAIGVDSGLFSNLSASIAPTTSNDTSQGYTVGSLWVDVIADVAYTCVDATLGNAVWKANSLVIDDTAANLTETWSSSKINTEIGVNTTAIATNGTDIATNTTNIGLNLPKSGGFMTGDLDTDSDYLKDGVISKLPLQTGSTTNLITERASGAGTITGTQLTSYGDGALYRNENGSTNSAFGFNSLRNNVSGNGNCTFGAQAGVLCTGSNNVCLGYLCNTTLSTQSDTITIGESTTNVFNDSILIGNNGTTTQANQCVINNVTEIVPGSDATCDLGSASKQMKDLYLDGNAIVPTAPTLGTHLCNKTYVDSNVDANTTDIATNTTDIATNTTGIATNTTDIATNTTNITALTKGNYFLTGTSEPGYYYTVESFGSLTAEVPDMTITPTAGTYLLHYSGLHTTSNVGGGGVVELYVDGTAVAYTQRNVRVYAGGEYTDINILAQVTVNGSEVVEIRHAAISYGTRAKGRAMSLVEI